LLIQTTVLARYYLLLGQAQGLRYCKNFFARPLGCIPWLRPRLKLKLRLVVPMRQQPNHKPHYQRQYQYQYQYQF